VGARRLLTLTARSALAAPPRTPPPRKRLSAEDRRSAILDAALEIFSRRGYNGASIDEIASAAGISKALIYEHFPSKKDLHVSLLERHTQDIFMRLAETADTKDPAEVRMRNGVNAFFEWAETHRDGFRLLFRDTFEPDVADVLERLQNQATGAIAALMASEPALQPGAETEVDLALAIEAMAQQLSGGVQSLAIWWQSHPDVTREWLVDRVMDYAWIGLRRIRATR
jgi:AcrR family transcriptional regulator